MLTRQLNAYLPFSYLFCTCHHHNGHFLHLFCEREVGRRAPNYPRGIQNDPKEINRRITFRINLRDRSRNPARGGLQTIRNTAYKKGGNNQDLRTSLDLLNERRETVEIWLVAYHKEIVWAHGWNIHSQTIQVRDYVLWKVVTNTKDPTDGRLGPNWEGLTEWSQTQEEELTSWKTWTINVYRVNGT